jgi:hypothetical protein
MPEKRRETLVQHRVRAIDASGGVRERDENGSVVLFLYSH